MGEGAKVQKLSFLSHTETVYSTWNLNWIFGVGYILVLNREDTCSVYKEVPFQHRTHNKDRVRLCSLVISSVVSGKAGGNSGSLGTIWGAVTKAELECVLRNVVDLKCWGMFIWRPNNQLKVSLNSHCRSLLGVPSSPVPVLCVLVSTSLFLSIGRGTSELKKSDYLNKSPQGGKKKQDNSFFFALIDVGKKLTISLPHWDSVVALPKDCVKTKGGYPNDV